MKDITVKVDVDGVIRNSFQVMCDLYNKEILPDVGMMGEGELKHMTVDDITDYDVEVSFPEVRHVTGRPAKKFFFEQHAKEVFGTAPYIRICLGNLDIIEFDIREFALFPLILVPQLVSLFLT